MGFMKRGSAARLVVVCSVLAAGVVHAQYVNFEVSQVHPIDLTPSGAKLLVVNTPDATLEVFTVDGAGNLVPDATVPVGLEPVTVVARSDSEAWVVNQLSDTVSVVDLATRTVVRTLRVGDEPTDVAFAAGRAFVAVRRADPIPGVPPAPNTKDLPEDLVRVYSLANLAAAPLNVPLFGSRIRALAVSSGGGTVYAVAQDSGNQTAVVDANIAFGNNANLNATRLAALGLNTMTCTSPPPPYPAMPAGIARNPALIDPPDGIPKVGLIVQWDPATSQWKDDAGQNWTACLPIRMPDHDLFAIDATTLAVTTVDHLGTTLFDVSVQPGTGKIWIPNTEARNMVRFEPRVNGHVVDDRLTVVNPSAGNAATIVDLNTHIDRGSNPATNLSERLASISQPGMMVWKSDGSTAYLTAIGSRKVFAVDGACANGSCIFGPTRGAPRAVDAGEGPTGVALHEGKNRLFVLNRFTNSVAVIDAPTLTKLGEVPLHDPSSVALRNGRRFMYDAVLTSGHGDIACSSCHISGDKDGISWDLGDPPGSFVPYSTANDNVRFVLPMSNQPVQCDPAVCASHQGFDPQKGPMATQTLRSMLEPLHWRGDRATMNDFNPAFVGLLGSRDVGPVSGKPAGLSAADMEAFRQFALAMRFPPNFYRRADDTLPTEFEIPFPADSHGTPPNFVSNPSRGLSVFDTFPTDGNQPCQSCHAHPFGAAGGQLGGVTPAEPTLPVTAALFNGNADQSPHSDVKIPHLRNMVDKPGFFFGTQANPYDVKAGIGFVHDGSIPNMLTFLSIAVFNLATADALDLAGLMFHFPTEFKPAVGRHLTCPQGAPPQTGCDESLLSTLTALGDLTNANRHCELTASALSGGRVKSYRLSGGSWLSDVAADPPLATAGLRTAAEGPISFLCATRGSGVRLGGDRDEDGVLNGGDCAPGDPGAWTSVAEIAGLALSGATPTALSWTSQAAATGPGVVYDVVGGLLSALRASGLVAATSCVGSNLTTAGFSDGRALPAPGDGFYYLTRAKNSCGVGVFGPGRAPLDPLTCP
jgi:YVTN family beta-propeller protein